MRAYKIKFQFGKMPYWVWVDAKDPDQAKKFAKAKVRGTYGYEREYKFLELVDLGPTEEQGQVS